MRKFVGLLSIPLIAALALGACSSDETKTTTDGKVTNPDGGPPPGGDKGVTPTPDKGEVVPPPTALDCTGDTCKDFVFDSLKLPASTEDAKKYGVDFDGNGTPDNQLGQILNALGSIVPDLALQPSVDEAVNSGKTIILARVQGGDFKDAAKAAAQAWLGKEVACCTDADPVACATESKTTCFKGDYEFETDTTEKMIFGGAISGGKGIFGPSTMTLSLPLSTGSLTLVLQAAQFEVTFDGDKITGGKLAGAITEKDLNEGVLPSVAAMLQSTVETSTGKTKEQILQLFDQPPTGNGDGQISLEEVQNNDIIKAFLQGDVDIDGDGKMELSLGVGFSAVGAKITNQ